MTFFAASFAVVAPGLVEWQSIEASIFKERGVLWKAHEDIKHFG